jgi:nitrous oxidase accessory protein NosD
VLAAVKITTDALAEADRGYAGRQEAIEAQLRGETDSGLRAAIRTTQNALIDLPSQYATAKRASDLEAQVNSEGGSRLLARAGEAATVIADQKFGVVAESVRVLRGEYDGTTVEVREQRGIINGLNSKAAAYVKIVADAGSGRAALSLWSDQYGGAWALTGDGVIEDDVTFRGKLEVNTDKSGQRTEITNQGIRIFDANNVLRVSMGVF